MRNSPVATEILVTPVMIGIMTEVIVEGRPLVASAIHAAGIPVAVLGLALGIPVCPDAELGIAEPFGALPSAEVVPIGFKVTCFYRYIFCRNIYFFMRTHITCGMRLCYRCRGTYGKQCHNE